MHLINSQSTQPVIPFSHRCLEGNSGGSKQHPQIGNAFGALHHPPPKSCSVPELGQNSWCTCNIQFLDKVYASGDFDSSDGGLRIGTHKSWFLPMCESVQATTSTHTSVFRGKGMFLSFTPAPKGWLFSSLGVAPTCHVRRKKLFKKYKNYNMVTRDQCIYVFESIQTEKSEKTRKRKNWQFLVRYGTVLNFKPALRCDGSAQSSNRSYSTTDWFGGFLETNKHSPQGTRARLP